MENENKKKPNAPIDEAYLMSIMAGETKKPQQLVTPQESTAEQPKETATEKPAAKERTRQKRASDTGYGERFLNSHTMTRRGDKSIYIRQEYHERLSRIVQVIGEDKIPLYAYLDNILEHHFEQFEKAITDDFNDKFKPIFKVFDYEEDTTKTTGKDTAQSPLSNGIFTVHWGCGQVRKIGLHQP